MMLESGCPLRSGRAGIVGHGWIIAEVAEWGKVRHAAGSLRQPIQRSRAAPRRSDARLPADRAPVVATGDIATSACDKLCGKRSRVGAA